MQYLGTGRSSTAGQDSFLRLTARRQHRMAAPELISALQSAKNYRPIYCEKFSSGSQYH